MRSCAEKRTFIKRVIILLVLLTVALSQILPLVGAEKIPTAVTPKNRIGIKVGYIITPEMAGDTEYTNGKHSGYTHEYLEAMAQYVGLDYEFVYAKTHEEMAVMYDKLAAGEIDLLYSTKYYQSMEKDFLYIQPNYSNRYTVLKCVNSQEQNVNDILGGKEVSVAIINARVDPSRDPATLTEKEKTELHRDFDKYTKENNIKAKITLCATEKEQLEKVKSGAVDVILTSSVNYFDDLTTIARFAQIPLYFITTKGNYEVCNRIGHAINLIKTLNPELEASLQERYFGDSADGEMYLSQENKNYIANKKTLNVLLNGQERPLKYYDDRKKEYSGVAVDMLNVIAQKAGLSINYTFAKNEKETQKELDSGRDYDIILALQNNESVALAHNCYLTAPYYTEAVSSVFKQSNIPHDGRRVAIVRGVNFEHKEGDIITCYATTEECVKAVDQGKADIAYGNAGIVNYVLTYRVFNSSIIQAITPQKNDLCFGVVKKEDTQLLQIMNKIILTTDKNQINSIIDRNLMLNYGDNFEFLLRTNPFTFSFLLIGVIVLVAIVVSVYYISKARIHKKEAVENEKFKEISEMFNEITFQYDYKKNEFEFIGKENDGRKVPEKDSAIQTKIIEFATKQVEGEQEVEIVGAEDRWYKLIGKIIFSKNLVPAFYIGKLVDITQDKNIVSKLVEQAQLDGSTKIFNAETAKRLIKQMIKQGNGVMVICDIDNFKQVNDKFGHIMGDDVIKEVARIFDKIFEGDTEIVGRLGGDEFIIYIDGKIDKEKIIKKFKKVQEELADSSNKLTSKLGIHISVGGAVLQKEDTFEDIYAKADSNLYKVKNAGKNGICID